MSALFLWAWTWARNKAIWYWRRLTSTITTPLHLLLSARYTYEALQNDDDSAIRLLYLYPGPGPLRMALKNVHLDYSDGAEATRKAPPYEAISYAWGDSTLTESVYCNDKRLDIPASLYAALRQLRPAEPGDSGSDTSAAPRVLWADAVCINQRDVDEKNHQVGLMDKIYARPTSVLIWVGADTEGLQDVGASIGRMRSLLPAETYDAQELIQISKDYYEKTAVSQCLDDCTQWYLLTDPSSDRTSRSRTSSTSTGTTMTGPRSTTCCAAHGLTANGSSRRSSWPREMSHGQSSAAISSCPGRILRRWDIPWQHMD